MALFQQIKQLLGLESGETDRGRARQDANSTENVAVTVEHDPDTEREDAVKGTETEATAESTDAADGSSDPADAAGADETGEATVEDPEEAGEAEDADTAETARETAAEPADDATAEGESAAAGSTEDVQSITGIGPAYAERLAEADVETVGELAAADADTVAEATGIAVSRVEGWIEQARE